MKFNLLGSFEIVTDEGALSDTPPPKVCQVLALLLTRPNAVVPVDSFIREIWRENPPRSALTTLQTYVYHARQMFARTGTADPEEVLLVTRAPGYLIHVDPGELDGKEFERLIEKGQRELVRGFAENAASHLAEAANLWRGPPLGNIATGDVLGGYVAYMDALRIRAVELRIDAIKRLGRYRELIPELHALVLAYPLNEWFHTQLIEALSLSGRRGEALQVYQRLRRSLGDELGLDPSPDVQRLHHQLLDPVRRGPAHAA